MRQVLQFSYSYVVKTDKCYRTIAEKRWLYGIIDVESLVGEDDYIITNISLGLSYAFKYRIVTTLCLFYLL